MKVYFLKFKGLANKKIQKNITVGVIYRHPRNSYAEFQNNLSNVVQFLNHSNSPFFLVGDYNIDLSKQNSDRKVENYLNDLYAAGCYSLINKPTRMTSTSSTTLDHIYLNAIDKFCISGILTYDISDHLPIFYIIKNKTCRSIGNKFIQ